MDLPPIGMSGIPLLLLGLLLCFAGQKIWAASVFLVGGLLGLGIGILIGMLLGPYLLFGSLICGAIGAVAGFLIGGYMALSFAEILLALAAAVLAFALGYQIGGLYVGLAAAAIVGILVYMLLEKLLQLGTAVVGGIMAGFAIGGLVTFPYAGPICTAALIVLGAYIQMRTGDSKPDRS